MRRWLPLALALSLLANVGLAIVWGSTVMWAAVGETDTASTFRYLAAERAQLQALRTEFCPGQAAPDRDAVLAWSARQPEAGEPFDKDGLLWLGAGGDVGVKLGADGQLTGVCLAQTWATLEQPSPAEQDRAGEFCPLEPLC